MFFAAVKMGLKAGKPVPASTRKLLPLLDDEHLLRMGGHLKNAVMIYNKNHPIILSKSAPVTELLND